MIHHASRALVLFLLAVTIASCSVPRDADDQREPSGADTGAGATTSSAGRTDSSGADSLDRGTTVGPDTGSSHGSDRAATSTPSGGADTSLRGGGTTPAVVHGPIRFRVAGEGIIIADIPFTFRNRSRNSLFFVNCGGNIAPSMQRRDGRAWSEWYNPARPECLSPPVVMAPGEGYSDTLHVEIRRRDEPRFYRDVMEGSVQAEYRLVWHNALLSFTSEYTAARGFGPKAPIGERTSHSFRIERPQ